MTKKKMRILHVEDEADTSKIVKTILEKEGFAVVSVDNGKDALIEIDQDGYNLLLLDIMMPDMSGWDLFTRISKLHKENNVIFLTVLKIPNERLQHLKKFGVKDYITKPFDRKDFVKRVKKALE